MKNQNFKTETLAKKKIPLHGRDCRHDPAISAVTVVNKVSVVALDEKMDLLTFCELSKCSANLVL